VSDSQWVNFCAAFGLDDLGADPEYALNAGRVKNRDDLMPRIRALFKTYDKQDLMVKLEHTGLPFAPISRPEDMFDDPHLRESGALVSLNLPEGGTAELPALPLEMAGRKFGLRHDLPDVGQHTAEILSQMGFDEASIQKMSAAGAIQ